MADETDLAYLEYIQERLQYRDDYEKACEPLYAVFKQKSHLAWLKYIKERSPDPKPGGYLCNHCQHWEASADLHVAPWHQCKLCNWITEKNGGVAGPGTHRFEQLKSSDAFSVLE